MIKLHNITKTFNDVIALKPLTFSAKQGTSTAISGPSGSGKSTLLNIIGLLDKSSEGEYLLEDQPVSHLTPDQYASLRREYFGFIFQHYYLIPEWSALDNILLASRYHPHNHDKNHLNYLCETLGITNILSQSSHVLSGGQQQRIAIARALLMKPKVLIADEPTTALDETHATTIRNLLIRICNELNQCLILATHDDRWLSSCDHIINLDAQP
ncbi:MAG TPA: ABC transporter ATP-binding protein [Gammaproteobacteria bacterium]|nr:ABC transporter ATP-binding protein [Gammaproteobacteria bacterium]